jgi:tetratricopeptide (TPR) repeat protein
MREKTFDGPSAVMLALALGVGLVGPESVRADEAPWPGLVAGPYAVGYATVDVTDHARTVAPPVDWRGTVRGGDNFRRVRVSIWYPASVDAGRPPMRYGDYVEAAGVETVMDGELLTGAEAYLAHSTFGGGDPERLAAMLAEPTTAHRDAPPLAGTFPAIVYAPSFSYEAFENSALFEYLASHGYVIAACRSSGPETREMAMSLAGAEASVRDLELMLNALHDFGHADLGRVGAAGFSWGGLTAAMLAMRNHNVRAVLALDGTFEHAELPAIEEQPGFLPRRLRGGYLAIVGDREPKRSLAGEALYADVVEMRYPALEHWDFASDMIRVGDSGAREPERRRLVGEAYALIAYQAGLLFDGYLRDDESHRRVLLDDEMRTHDGAIEIETLTARAALPAPPSSAEFAALLREDVGEARRVLAAARADPGIELIDWMQLQDVVTSSPFETKLEILELVRDEQGESSVYFNNLGQAWRLEGEPEKALGYFRKALEHNPDSSFARRSIEELEAERKPG